MTAQRALSRLFTYAPIETRHVMFGFSLVSLQIVEKPSELEIPDQTDSDERILIERIKSIKQEK